MTNAERNCPCSLIDFFVHIKYDVFHMVINFNIIFINYF